MIYLVKIIFHNFLGWKISGNFSADVPKTVIIVLPHTSWHDFYIGVFTRKILNIPIQYVAKNELFDSPLGWYFKWMGGEPIERSSKQNKVEQIVQMFDNHDEFRLAIAPEGTRKKVETWRSGFYYIAHQAKVPITSVAFDYATKTVKISEPFMTTGVYEQDLKHLKLFYKGVVGKVPEYT